ncbi:uncharacterized protein LOC143021182 [Oratosquilla oratoria]|uniref:uncharacterized protein LOC143021182 n=1 Tax=Oratosquilla oratoria TaxID=337810 RepID=UPI003F775134
MHHIKTVSFIPPRHRATSLNSFTPLSAEKKPAQRSYSGNPLPHSWPNGHFRKGVCGWTFRINHRKFKIPGSVQVAQASTTPPPPPYPLPSYSAARIEPSLSIAEPDESVTQQPTFFSCRSGDSPAVAFSPNAWFPQEKGEKALDIPALFERAQDQPKTVPPRRHIPSSFPVVLPPPFAPEGLRDCLWHSGRDPALPHQLSEPEAKLLTTEASTRQDLASTISTVMAIAMMRNWLTTLATSFEDFPREELRDTLAALSTVAEGTANMASSALPPAARAFTAARLAARQSATRSAPEIARRGVVRAAPLSRGLFDQEATDRVFATVPTVIQIQQPSQPSETRDSDHLR